MTAKLLALGDSFSCGEGVGVMVRREQIWVARLAEMLQRDPVLLARPGARVADVRSVQASAAHRYPASFASVLIGLNDVLRNGFDARAIRDDICEIVGRLRRGGHVVLLVRLHDPTALLPLPRPLRWHLESRVAAVNGAVDAVHGPGVHVLDLRQVEALRHREAWAVDRLHPSPVGQYAIAAAAAEVLAVAGYPVRRSLPDPSGTARPTRYDEGLWILKHGMPWVARHLGDVAAPLATALVARRG